MKIYELLSATRPKLLNWVWQNTKDIEYENFDTFYGLTRKSKSIIYNIMLKDHSDTTAFQQLHDIYKKKVPTNTTFSPHIYNGNVGKNSNSWVPLNKKTRYRLKLAINSLSSDELEEVNIFVADLVAGGIKEFEYKLDILNIDYAGIVASINQTLNSGSITEGDLKMAMHVINRVDRGDTFSLQSKVLRRLFKVDVNTAMEVLEDFGVLELVSNHLAGWKSKTYKLFADTAFHAPIEFATEKQIKLLKRIKMKRNEYNLDEKIELLESREVEGMSEEDSKALIEVIEKVKLGYAFLQRHKVEDIKASDGFENPMMFKSFGLYYVKLIDDLLDGKPFRTFSEYAFDRVALKVDPILNIANKIDTASDKDVLALFGC